MQLDEEHQSNPEVKNCDLRTDQADAKILQLFRALATEFPDAGFIAKAMILLAGAIGSFLPADKRLGVARVMLDQATKLGTLWH
jgi:hypothetical protein